eukprot:TRINITY_DN3471_c0_g1_i1.p1 TRINITY_DN3471_c0_g1~~TRINITY_DN3471_c0_g1_i1.p1  ORF type:complete len:633 (-),score=154.36 TRINITY_DN3471_c0_g1_i1:323-2221(-)
MEGGYRRNVQHVQQNGRPQFPVAGVSGAVPDQSLQWTVKNTFLNFAASGDEEDHAGTCDPKGFGRCSSDPGICDRLQADMWSNELDGSAGHFTMEMHLRGCDSSDGEDSKRSDTTVRDGLESRQAASGHSSKSGHQALLPPAAAVQQAFAQGAEASPSSSIPDAEFSPKTAAKIRQRKGGGTNAANHDQGGSPSRRGDMPCRAARGKMSSRDSRLALENARLAEENKVLMQKYLAATTQAAAADRACEDVGGRGDRRSFKPSAAPQQKPKRVLQLDEAIRSPTGGSIPQEATMQAPSQQRRPQQQQQPPQQQQQQQPQQLQPQQQQCRQSQAHVTPNELQESFMQLAGTFSAGLNAGRPKPADEAADLQQLVDTERQQMQLQLQLQQQLLQHLQQLQTAQQQQLTQQSAPTPHTAPVLATAMGKSAEQKAGTPSAALPLLLPVMQVGGGSPVATLSAASPSQMSEPFQECPEADNGSDSKEDASPVPPDQRTTIMLRNLPNNYTLPRFLAMIDGEGFSGKYDFVYLPMDFSTKACLGYAFVNLHSHVEALTMWKTFQDFSAWSIPSKKLCRVSWSSPHQGLRANIDRYRNSAVMHPDVPDDYKPKLFAEGRSIPFPSVTRTLRAPRLRATRK